MKKKQHYNTAPSERKIIDMEAKRQQEIEAHKIIEEAAKRDEAACAKEILEVCKKYNCYQTVSGILIRGQWKELGIIVHKKK